MPRKTNVPEQHIRAIFICIVCGHFGRPHYQEVQKASNMPYQHIRGFLLCSCGQPHLAFNITINKGAISDSGWHSSSRHIMM